MTEPKKITRTGEGIPVGTSREEERLDELKREREHEATLLQRTETGYEEITESEIPLSDAAGEGRRRDAGTQREGGIDNG